MRLSAAIISALAAVASAATQPDTSQPPSGNPIALPGLDELVPVGKPYTITWEPTTPGKVSIFLLRGPSDNVVPIATLADAVDNSGHFQWTPASSLEADASHYGIQIVVEGTGQYQYSTQFGIENDDQDTDPEPTYATDAPEPTYATDVPEPTYPTDVPEPTYPTDVPEPTYPSETPEPTSDIPEEPTYPTDVEPTYPTETPEEPEPTYPTEAPEPTYPTEAPEPTYPAEPTSYTWITVSVPTTAPASSSPTPSSTPPASYTPVVPSSSAPAPPQFTGAAGRNSAASLGGVAAAGLVALFAF